MSSNQPNKPQASPSPNQPPQDHHLQPPENLSTNPLNDPETCNSLKSDESRFVFSGVSSPISSIGSRKTRLDIDDPRNGRVGLYLPEFLNHPIQQQPWIIKPFLPAGGVVLLHGPTSIGKSPLMWRAACCAASGEDFFGMTPERTGNVIFVELDTPAMLLQERLSHLIGKPPENFWLECLGKPIDILKLSEALTYRFNQLQRAFEPVLVVINTLRKCHRLDDKDSGAAARVYGAWRELFPTALLVFVGHDKKSDAKNQTDPDHAHSGTQHWADDAQVVLHMTKTTRDGKRSIAHIKMTKSQVSDNEACPLLHLELDEHGANFIEVGPGAYRKFYQSLDSALSKASRIARVQEHFGIGKSAAYAAVKDLDTEQNEEST